jgi:hypothetical protein
MADSDQLVAYVLVGLLVATAATMVAVGWVCHLRAQRRLRVEENDPVQVSQV